MNLRFQADADLNPEVGRGLRRREPAIDFRPAGGVIPDGTSDSEVLRLAALDGRVLVSRDVRTMPRYFQEFIAQNNSPGVILIPSSREIGEVIEGLLLVYLNWSAGTLQNQIRWLPAIE